VLAAGVEPFALSALKYGLLALLFLFVWRAMRWVVRGLNVDQAVPSPTRGAAAPKGGATVPQVATLAVFPPDGGKPRTIRIDASVTIGRAPECELRIDDTYASQQHARVFGKGGSWYVEDLGSTNGTYVNEQRLAAPAMLTAGDRIRVGTTVVELRR
jgi:pSer/pThr/pTyr-binding forkhead associated (FHA) protein